MKHLLASFIIIFTHVCNAQTFTKGPALIEGTVSITAAAGTTTLTKDSQTNETVIGSTTQTIRLPDATTLPVGRRFYITNRTTASNVTVVDNGSNTLRTMLFNTQVTVILKDNSTANGTWDVSFTKIDASGGGITGIVPVVNGGTGLSSGTSGGILGFTASGTIASSAALTANQLIIGGGAGATPSTLAAGSQYQVLRMGATTPAYGSIDLSQSAAVTGILGLSNGGSNKNFTASAGSVLYSDADSFEATAVGTAGQALISGGTSAPTWYAPTAGSVLFGGTSGILQQDNTNFFWDDTNNRLGVGPGASGNTLTIGGVSYGNVFSVHSEGATDAAEFRVDRHSDTAGLGAFHVTARSRGTTASPTVVASGDVINRMTGVGYDGTDYEPVASINMNVDATPGSNDMPGNIILQTTPDGSRTLTQRMIIKNDGRVSLGASDPTTSALLDLQGTTGSLLLTRLTTTQRDALTPTAGMVIYNSTNARVECYFNTAWGECTRDLIQVNLGLSNTSAISISTVTYKQTFSVAGAASPVLLNSVPFGSTDPVDGAEITLIGTTDSNAVTIPVNNAANGVVGYQVTLGLGMVVTYKYNASADRYYIKSFSN